MYTIFETEYQYFQNLPNVEVFIESTTCELPYLKGIFEYLQQTPWFKSQRFVLDSVYHPGTEVFIKHGLQDSIVFFLSNENHCLPTYKDEVKLIFTPYIPYQDCPSYVHAIPLGWNGDLPQMDFIPWSDRTIDVFFRGQLIPQFDYRDRFQLALGDLEFKTQSRQLPYCYDLEFSEAFRQGLSPQEYIQTMMKSKIALVPRGYSHITYRLFEAALCGTVIISENFLAPAYLTDFPWVRINHWGDLTKIIFHLLKYPHIMQQLHLATLQFYQEHLSEQAVAEFISKIVVAKLTCERDKF